MLQNTEFWEWMTQMNIDVDIIQEISLYKPCMKFVSLVLAKTDFVFKDVTTQD